MRNNAKVIGALRRGPPDLRQREPRGGGTVTDCEIIGPDAPLKATYILGMDYADWKALHDGYDAQRTVMYGEIRLEEGTLLDFFKGAYFFTECLAVIGTVPADYPQLAIR